MTFTDPQVATRGIMRFAGLYGIKSITIRSNMIQRANSSADVIVESNNPAIEPVELLNVKYPHVVTRRVQQLLMATFTVRRHLVELPNEV